MLKKQLLIFTLFCTPLLGSGQKIRIRQQRRKTQQIGQRRKYKQPKTPTTIAARIMLAFENKCSYPVRFKTTLFSEKEVEFSGEMVPVLHKSDQLDILQIKGFEKGGIEFSTRPGTTLTHLTVEGFNHIRKFKASWRFENPQPGQLLHFIAEEEKK